MTPRVLCVSGPNLQLLGTREPQVYGKTTLGDIHARLEARRGENVVGIDSGRGNSLAYAVGRRRQYQRPLQLTGNDVHEGLFVLRCDSGPHSG